MWVPPGTCDLAALGPQPSLSRPHFLPGVGGAPLCWSLLWMWASPSAPKAQLQWVPPPLALEKDVVDDHRHPGASWDRQ